MAESRLHADYDDRYNTYILKRDELLREEWDTEVGDRRDETRFVPRVKISRWGDGLFEFGVPSGLQGSGDTVTHDREAIVWERGIYKAKFYDWPDDPDDTQGRGSFEWEFILASIPPRNSFTLDLRKANVEMLYQAALTAQEIADGVIRPERVVGSYAIYHASKRDHEVGKTNYSVGKIGHLYRPKVTDNLGDTIWGEWNTDAQTSGELTLTVDAAWLAAAAYPVTIDPTFGFSDIPLTTQGSGNGTLAYGNSNATYQHTASSGDTVTLLSVYCVRAFGTPSGNAAVYDVSGSDPNNLLVQGTFTPPTSTPDWADTAALSTAMVASTVYTVAWLSATNSDWTIYFDTGGTNESSRDTADVTFTLNDPWTEDVSANSQRFGMYATYTVSSTRRIMVVS